MPKEIRPPTPGRPKLRLVQPGEKTGPPPVDESNLNHLLGNIEHYDPYLLLTPDQVVRHRLTTLHAVISEITNAHTVDTWQPSEHNERNFLKNFPNLCDVGCYTGIFLPFEFESYGLGSITALDINSSKVNATKANLNLKNNLDSGRLRIVQCDGTAMGFADNSFNYVIAIELMDKLKSAEKARRLLEEMYRVGRPGGLAVVNAVDRNAATMASLTTDFNPRISGFYSYEFERLIREAYKDHCSIHWLGQAPQLLPNGAPAGQHYYDAGNGLIRVEPDAHRVINAYTKEGKYLNPVHMIAVITNKKRS